MFVRAFSSSALTDPFQCWVLLVGTLQLGGFELECSPWWGRKQWSSFTVTSTCSHMFKLFRFCGKDRYPRDNVLLLMSRGSLSPVILEKNVSNLITCSEWALAAFLIYTSLPKLIKFPLKWAYWWMPVFWPVLPPLSTLVCARAGVLRLPACWRAREAHQLG